MGSLLGNIRLTFAIAAMAVCSIAIAIGGAAEYSALPPSCPRAAFAICRGRSMSTAAATTRASSFTSGRFGVYGVYRS